MDETLFSELLKSIPAARRLPGKPDSPPPINPDKAQLTNEDMRKIPEDS